MEEIHGEDIKFITILYSQKYIKTIKEFDCGNSEINDYLLKKAKEDYDCGIGVTKIILNEKEDKIIGFYTLSCSAMVVETDEKKHFIQLSPAVELKMFAIDKNFQDIGYSSDKEDGVFSDWLLIEPIKEIRDLSDNVCGAKYIILYAVPNAIKFYERNGFFSFEKFMKQSNNRYLNGCKPMFISL